MERGSLPPGLMLHRTTDVFTDTTVPAGLLRAHRVAQGLWGRLVVLEGRLRFVWEVAESGDPLDLVGGDSYSASALITSSSGGTGDTIRRSPAPSKSESSRRVSPMPLANE